MTTFRQIGFAISAIVILVSIFIYLHIPNTQCQSFSDQAQSFIHGRLDIPPRIDAVYYNGKYYWPQGPFSSLILIPFQILFGPSFNQTILQPFLILLLSLALYKLSRLKNFSIRDSLELIYAFLFGSIVIGIITESCYSFFAHIVSMTLLSYLLLEFEGKRRWWLLGIISAFMITARPTASFIIVVIFYYLFHSDKKSAQKYSRFILFALPILSSILFLMWFNQARLHNPFDTGESTNNVGDYLESLRQKGLFNLEYIPTNFYYYFLSSVQPVIKQSTRLVFPFFTYNPLGLSFFIVSPFFLFALGSLKKKVLLIRLYWTTVLLTLFILLSYFASGWVQFGPRFTSDFMPILYLLTLYGLKSSRLTTKQSILILVSSLVNAYLLLTGFFLFKS